jgi:hypothetical protein
MMEKISSLNLKNVVNLKFNYTENNFMFLVLEYGRCSLKDLLAFRGKPYT